MSFKIALVQFKPALKDVKANLNKIQNLLSGITADLIVLPELSNTGYLYENSSKLLPYADSNDGSDSFLGGLITLAKTTQGVIITGYAELAGDEIYNSAAAVTKYGVIGNYRKAHLFSDEKLLFQPGKTGFTIIEWLGVKIGMMICFDWIFPEAARTLALKGAQIIAHPANLVLPYCQNAMITRSIENKVFTITANRIGKERLKNQSLTFTGVSQITDPSGRILYRGPKQKETVHVMTIKPDEARNKQLTDKNDLFDDRHPELYELSQSGE